jgi:hypothetical protein
MAIDFCECQYEESRWAGDSEAVSEYRVALDAVAQTKQLNMFLVPFLVDYH